MTASMPSDRPEPGSDRSNRLVYAVFGALALCVVAASLLPVPKTPDCDRYVAAYTDISQKPVTDSVQEAVRDTGKLQRLLDIARASHCNMDRFGDVEMLKAPISQK